MQNGTHVNGTTNGVHKDPAIITEHDLSWDGLSPAVTKALSQTLDPALVSQRRGRAGRTYEYLEGHVVIDQANRIFGYGGWGYELLGDVPLRRIETMDPKTGEVRVSHAYSAPVRVTVSGAQPRTDVGFHAVAEETPEGHDTAIKGAVTDGMKRALRSFGDQFGNALYGDPAKRTPARDSQETPKGQGRDNDSGGSQLAALRTGLINLGAEQGFEEAQVREATRSRTGKELEELTVDELEPLVKSAARKLKERQQEQAA